MTMAQSRPEIDGLISKSTEFDEAEYLQSRADAHNRVAGKVTDCAMCKGRGAVYFVRENEVVSRECDCMAIWRSRRRIAKSGLSEIVGKYTFDTFRVTSLWQSEMKKTAQSYVLNPLEQWLYCGGTVGCGKTHICTAVCGELLKSGHSVIYMLWRDEATKLKACITDDAEYAKLITPIKTAEVLYIDDFFKTQQGKPPTQADVNLAFEILNYRYNNRKLMTIISTERTVADLLDIDEAVGSRIYERTKDFCVEILPGAGKNYRLRA